MNDLTQDEQVELNELVEAVEADAAEEAAAKPKPKAKKKGGLDLDEPYGTVHGLPGVTHFQNGKYYGPGGKVVNIEG